VPKNPLADDYYKSRLEEKEHPIRGEYFRDQTAIIHSMPFRRLKHKTQVFFAPNNDHVCTRIEHVMHVASIAATICKGLNNSNPDNWNLDTELAYSIGIGHDLGHAPFGHAGETAISQKLPPGKQFMHEINSLRVIDKLANNGNGLNLTLAVRDGIICHNGEQFEQKIKPSSEARDPAGIIKRDCLPLTFEGCIVRFSDKIAYLGRDIEDAIIAGFIKTSDVDLKLMDELGTSNGEIINTLVNDIINTSVNLDVIQFSEEKHTLMRMLKDFNYERIYNHPTITRYKKFGTNIISHLFDYLCNLYCELGTDYDSYCGIERISLDNHFGNYLRKMDVFYKKELYVPQQIVTDYVSGMTDEYALQCMKQISIPAPINFMN